MSEDTSGVGVEYTLFSRMASVRDSKLVQRRGCGVPRIERR